MPELDGFAASRSIRALEREEGRRPVPIVARTGNSASDYGEACIAAGMNGFLTKPVGLDAPRAPLCLLGRMPAGQTSREPSRALAFTTPTSRRHRLGLT